MGAAAGAVSEKPIIMSEKSEETQELVLSALASNILFNHLEEAAVLNLVMAMEEQNHPKGTQLIEQGATGADYMYVIDSGETDVFVGGNNVASFGKGKVVGELALMYDAPRAATVVAKTDLRVWALNRTAFQQMLKNAGSAKADFATASISAIPLFAPLSDSEKAQIVDAMETVSYMDEEEIITEGEEGDCLYIIEEVRGRPDTAGFLLQLLAA
jgi:cAMP-dependent protein kinase regulator